MCEHDKFVARKVREGDGGMGRWEGAYKEYQSRWGVEEGKGFEGCR